MVDGVNMRNTLIVGLDPGTTTGMAILDSNGDVLNIYSKRDITRAEIIGRIMSFGNPVIISSDVSSVPSSVERIAIKLGCIVYSPDVSPSLNEKRELTKEYRNILKNDHETDALSAAIKAWKNYRTLFSRVREVLKRFNREEIFPDIMLNLLKEESPNIEDAIREFVDKERPIVIEKPQKENNQNDFIGKLQKKLGEKQQQLDDLRNQNTLLSKALNSVRKELQQLKEIKSESMTDNYQDIKNLIDYAKKLRRLEIKGYYPIIGIEKVELDLIEQMNDRIDLDSRVILVEDKENLSLLNDRNIKCLIVLEELDISDIKNLEFPVVQIDEEALESFDDIKAIKIDYIEKRLADAKKLGLVGWLKGYRNRRD